MKKKTLLCIAAVSFVLGSLAYGFWQSLNPPQPAIEPCGMMMVGEIHATA